MKKTNFQIDSLPYVRHNHLCEISANGERWDYNRQLDSDAVQRLPQKRHLAYPVVLHFVHEHRHMEPCEPHMRLVIEIRGDDAICDVPLNYFDKLPKLHVVSKNGKGLFSCFSMRMESCGKFVPLRVRGTWGRQ